MVRITDLNFAYGGVQALRDVNMVIPTGKVTCVMGRNGVGKTTLMRNIMGLLKPASGSIIVDGQDMTRAPAHRTAKGGVAIVPQGRMIFPKLTIEENLRVALSARRDGKRKIPAQIYDTFPVLKQMSKRRGGDLSGGQQQQLAIARAMVGEPKVMLLDEPTEGIQPNIIQQIGHVLHRLIDEMGMTIILVEQYLDFVKEFGHHFYVMNRGRVVAEGATDQLTSQIVREHLSV
ncbi:MAG: urea ABC transporter ATP-binding subunit UrtE [Planctomycetes bacterium]|nr:urea ABC transporter ATP-binding subunit UrtE [Planctomycetota bacterium]